MLDGFKQHDLLTSSSAISFQILTAVVPFVMFALALAGLLHLDGVWRNHVAPEIRTHVSAATFSVISSAVNKAVSGRQLLWATFGGGLALWQVSGAVRAVMGAFDRIYGARSERSFFRRYLISFALAIATGGCFILGHTVLGARAVLWWVIVSVGFYFYLTTLAVYGSVFGSLASVIAVMANLYISTTAFLFGAQLDAIIRAQATWDPSWRPSRSVAAV